VLINTFHVFICILLYNLTSLLPPQFSIFLSWVHQFWLVNYTNNMDHPRFWAKLQQTFTNSVTVNLVRNIKNFVHSWIHTLKDTWDLGARGLSDCVEGIWRDWNQPRKYPRLAWAGWRRPWISAWQEQIAAEISFYLFSSALSILLNSPFICFLIFYVLGPSVASLIQIIG
jgi:hypothetical protein